MKEDCSNFFTRECKTFILCKVNIIVFMIISVSVKDLLKMFTSAVYIYFKCHIKYMTSTFNQTVIYNMGISLDDNKEITPEVLDMEASMNKNLWRYLRYLKGCLTM